VEEMTVPPYIPGHCHPAILFIGQAPASEEVRKGEPFVGPAGQEFNRLLRTAGLVRMDHAITNVFDEQLPKAGMDGVTITTKELRERKKAEKEDAEAKRFFDGQLLYALYDLPPIKRGRYLRPKWANHLGRLACEIEEIAPTLIVPMGDEALWAVTGNFGITAHRGSVGMTSAPWLRGSYKILPTYHPSYILRNYRARIAVISDLMKAKREMEYPEVQLPKRELWLEPSLDDIKAFKRRYLDDAEIISVDIETAKGQITCIAFAPSNTLALCVPFSDFGGKWNYWESLEEEQEAWRLVRDILALPVPKLLQNGPYDAQWLWVKMRVPVVNYLHDTRLLHHALYPELPKDLRTMGSIYENEGAWKQMRERKAEKRDE
jgi:uracil-DNA glycosylase